MNAQQPIRVGVEFAPIFQGEMSFPVDVINQGLAYQIGGNLVFDDFSRVAIGDAKARVKVRGTETEEEAILEPVDIPRTCTLDGSGSAGGPNAGDFPPCEDDGDCPGQNNRCRSFVDFEVTTDCEACAELSQDAASSCEMRGFCATEDLAFELESEPGLYLAEEPGTVFFGWSDELPIVESGVDRGAFALRENRRNEPGVILNGLDTGLGGIDLYWECVMGVLGRGPDGPPTANATVSPAPSGMLIACPSQVP